MADDKPKDRPPTSRLGRLSRLAALAPRSIPFMIEGARRAVAQNRSEEDLREARNRMHAEMKKTAEVMLKTLGDMKGLPLKFGQMASYIDGLAPPGYEARFQTALKKLLDKAPPLSPAAAVQMIRSELGAHPKEIFAHWEDEPFAAASIGQVHRATTKDGVLVAVKVQYPGMDKAIESDLSSMSMLETLVAPLAKKLNTRQTLDELRAVFMAELDYAREAEMVDLFRRMNEGDPNVVVPRVLHSLTTRRVITLEYIDGMGYAEFCASASQEEKNRAGLTIWNFVFASMLGHGMLYADPHPGNYRFLPSGRVAFLDFGCVKHLPAELVAGMKRYMVAALDGDGEEFDRACVEVLGYDPSDETWQLYRGYTIELLAPFCSNEVWQFSPDKARDNVHFLARGLKEIVSRDKLPHVPFVPKIPQDYTFVNRLQWGLASVLAGLRTEANFRPMFELLARGPLRPLPE